MAPKGIGNFTSAQGATEAPLPGHSLGAHGRVSRECRTTDWQILSCLVSLVRATAGTREAAPLDSKRPESRGQLPLDRSAGRRNGQPPRHRPGHVGNHGGGPRWGAGPSGWPAEHAGEAPGLRRSHLMTPGGAKEFPHADCVTEAPTATISSKELFAYLRNTFGGLPT